MNKMMSNKKAILIFVLPAAIIFSMVILVTIASSGLISLLDWNGMGRAEFVGLKNYAELLHDRVFRNAIGNSLVFLACTLVLQLPVAVFLAILIVDCGKREKNIPNHLFYPCHYYDFRHRSVMDEII